MISDFLRERSARAESESFTLDKLRHRGRLKLLDALRRRACALLFAEDPIGQAILADRVARASRR